MPSNGLRDTLGLLVSSVTPGGPAEKAGIEEGNRLQSINSVSLRAPKEDVEDWGSHGFLQRRLTRELEKVKPGDEVSLRVYGGGRTREVKVKTADAEELYERRATAAGRRGDLRAMGDSMRKAAEERASLGISIGSSGSLRDTLGLLVMSLTESGPAEKAGIEEGTRIQSIDGIDLRVPRDDAEDGVIANTRSRRLTRALQAKKAGDEVELRLYSGGQTRTVRVKTVRAADLPRGGRFFFERGMAPMPPMPLMMPRRPMPPRAPGGGFGFQFDDDDIVIHNVDPDGIHIEVDGERIGRELRRIGPEIRARMREIGPEVRYNVQRAMRELEYGLGAGLDGLGEGLEEVGRALENLRFDVDVDVDTSGRRETRTLAPARTPAPIVRSNVTSF